MSTKENPSTIELMVKFISFDPQVTTVTLNDDDWKNITITAIVLGLAPLLHWHLKQLDFAPPPLALAKLGVTHQAHTKRNQAIARQLDEILTKCAAQQIDVLVLKGALLAPLAYPEVGLRPMNDIDLLFQPQDLPQVADLLTILGYQGKYKDANQGPGITKHLSTYRREGQNGATPNPYLSAAADRTVEPHGSLEESWFGLKVDITPGVWQRAVPLTLHGQPAYRLATGDLIIHLCVHATFHVIMGASLFVQLYDLGRVIKTWPDQFEWDQILDRASQAKATPFVYAALYWANQLYQVDVAAEVLTSFENECPYDLVNYIQSLDTTALFKRTQQPPLTTLAQRLRRGLLDRQESARWVASFGAKWKVWQTALAFYKSDTATLFTGKRLKVDL